MQHFFKLSLCALFFLGAQPAFSQLQNINLVQRSTMDFPGQSLANVCGYWQNGQEYALLGGSQGLIIVDITNPTSPQQIVQIPGPDNLWKEIKVYGHYAYVTSEGGEGLQIVDLSGLPSANLTYKYYTGDGAIQGDLDEIHALHIDVTKGFLYTFGGNIAPGGAKVFDLKQDPYNPQFVTRFEQLGYIHDGYADNDTLYACHIGAGIMSVVDMSDKSNPTVLGTVATPGKFTHNAWITDDRKHVLTTDEDTPSFLASYDVSDPSDMQELDRISPNNGAGTYVHNTHILNDYAVTSWYTSGVLIVDAHRPQNLVTVAQFDTYAGNSLEFEGCWGVFPYFPSGNVITSDINPGQMTVLTPTYKRACYFEGRVLSACTGLPLNGATVTINSVSNPQKIVETGANGVFRTGIVTPGDYTATITAPGFPNKTVNITLQTAQVTEMEVIMDAGAVINISGTITEFGSNLPLASAQIILQNGGSVFNAATNALGQFNLECVPAANYSVIASKWGYIAQTTSLVQGTPVGIALKPGYYDDFVSDLGWTTSSTASSGEWELGNPVGTLYDGIQSNPQQDAAGDNNGDCYTTGNGSSSAGGDDVDNGITSLITPVMKLANATDAVLTFKYWFFNDGGNGSAPNDQLQVNLLKGNQTFLIFSETASEGAWKNSPEIRLSDFTTLNDNMRIQFVARDDNPGHLVESAIDIFEIKTSTVGTVPVLDASAQFTASPNPSVHDFVLQYAWENAAQMPVLEVRNALGQVLVSQTLTAKSGTLRTGNDWVAGVYFAQLKSEGRLSGVISLVKQ